MKILLVCAVGILTSLVVNKMEKALEPDEQDWVIEAKPAERLSEVIDDYDVILLGPQIAYKKSELKRIAVEKGEPLDVINTVVAVTILKP